MRREEVIEKLEKKLDELGVPESTRSIRKVPSKVELSLIIPPGGGRRLEFRSGITAFELNEKLEGLERDWQSRVVGQADLEEAIK